MISDNLISHFPPYKLYRGSGKQLIGAICSVSALYWQIARLGLANLVPHPHHVTKQHNYKSIWLDNVLKTSHDLHIEELR